MDRDEILNRFTKRYKDIDRWDVRNQILRQVGEDDWNAILDAEDLFTTGVAMNIDYSKEQLAVISKIEHKYRRVPITKAQNKDVYIPQKPLVRERWINTWTLVKNKWYYTNSVEACCEELERKLKQQSMNLKGVKLHPCGVDTMRKIIRVGVLGLLDK